MTEKWKVINGFENYMINNIGQIKRIGGTIRCKVNRLLKQSVDRDGYHYVVIRRNKKSIQLRIHRLVLITFVRLPLKGEQSNHIDGNKFNNAVDNLEWCFCSENIRHAFKLGLKNQKGEYNNASTVSDHEVYLIKSMINNTLYTQKEIASIFHVTQQTVSDFKLGRRRKDIKYDIRGII